MYHYGTQKSKIQTLRNLNNVSLLDLKKIKKSLSNHKKRIEEYEREKSYAIKENEKISKINLMEKSKEEKWERDNIDPIRNEREKLTRLLQKCRVGFISGMLFDTVRFEGVDYKSEIANGLIEKIKNLRCRWDQTYEKKPNFQYQPLISCPAEPRDDAYLTIGGQKIRIAFSQIDEAELDGIINDHLRKINENNAKVNTIKARAAANESEKRRQAKTFKKNLSKQLALIHGCPYCGGELSDQNSHLDHIYPVSKGGNSSEKNLVFVCSNCNLGKRNMTLRNFLKSSNFDEAVVYYRLEILKKDF